MLADNRIVFTERHLFRQIARVFLCDIVVPGASGADELDLDAGTLQSEPQLVSTRFEGGSRNLVPSWSPDGSMIAFNTGRFGGGSAEILRRNISGGETWGLNPTRLTFAQPHHSASANNFISWSPDGKQIAFESDRDRDDPEIYLINAVDGTNAQRLTYTRALDEVPSWSPDSKEILFSSDMHGEPQSGEYDIYIMNRDGSN